MKFKTFIRNLCCLSIALVFYTPPVQAQSLKETKLFTKIASGCQDINLDTWKHPVRNVLIESGAKITRVSLCNNKKYPIFFAQFPYDPNSSQTDDYFHPLYLKILKANGNWPFSIVDEGDGFVVNVRAIPKGISLRYESVDYSDSNKPKSDQLP